MNNGAKVWLLEAAIWGISAAVYLGADYAVKKTKENLIKKAEQKIQDKIDGVVWTIDACDVVEIYRDVEVVG